MRHFQLLIAAWVGTCSLTGCEGGTDLPACMADVECAPGYFCDPGLRTCTMHPSACASPLECGTNETCGSDGTCRVGDCSFHGCVTGYYCALVESALVCLEGAGGASYGPPPGSAAGSLSQ